jgi:hypothetical protein
VADDADDLHRRDPVLGVSGEAVADWALSRKVAPREPLVDDDHVAVGVGLLEEAALEQRDVEGAQVLRRDGVDVRLLVLAPVQLRPALDGERRLGGAEDGPRMGRPIETEAEVTPGTSLALRRSSSVKRRMLSPLP